MSQPKFNPKQFNQYREDNRLEAKAANGGLPGTLWDTYSSFANSYGGCIVCGAVERKDGSWKTTGLKDLEKIKKQFWDTIHNKKKVSLCLLKETDVDEFLIGDDVVLVIRVSQRVKWKRRFSYRRGMNYNRSSTRRKASIPLIQQRS